jgi:deferrochelatase/peroxidase EfeB
MNYSIWYSIDDSEFEIKIKIKDNNIKNIFQIIRKIIKEIKKLKGLSV